MGPDLDLDYDIAHPPTPEAWLAMDESERILLVEEFHRRTRSPTGARPEVHASMHVVIENRLAEGHAAVVDAYERCRAAGLDRHTTIHALASVATNHALDVLRSNTPFQASADEDYARIDPAQWKPKPTLSNPLRPVNRNAMKAKRRQRRR